MQCFPHEVYLRHIGICATHSQESQATQMGTFTIFYTLASTHAFKGEASHALFSKLKKLWKMCPENTLVNCIAQSFLFIGTIFKVFESLYFLILPKKSLLFSKISGWVPGLTISTLKTMQVKSYSWNISTLRTTRTFVQTLAKEALLTRVDSYVWEMRECLIKKPFLVD